MKHPVLLVHGIWDTGDGRFGRMKPYLERAQLSVHTLNLVPNNGEAALTDLARQLDGHIRTSFPAGETIDLVGFSMGGLVSRYYVQRLGGLHRVRKLLTIGTPHRGTWTAFLRGYSGARDMRPGSAFLQDLNSDLHVLDALSFTSIWTPLDLMIVPAASSRLPVGRSIQLNVLAHPLLVRDARVLQLVASILNE